MRRLLLVVLLTACAAAQFGARPWFLGLDGGVYRGTERVGIGTGTSLAVVDDTAFLVGLDQHIWKSGPGGDWRMADPVALASKVVAAGDGSIFLLGTDGGAWHMGVGRVGLGVGSDLAVGEDHDLYLVGTDSRVWLCENESGNWKPYNSSVLARKVAAAPNGAVCILGLAGEVYALDSRYGSRLGGMVAQSLSLATDGTPYVVGLDNAVYFYRGGDWQRLGSGYARQIAWPR